MDAGLDPKVYPMMLKASAKLSKPSLFKPSESYFEIEGFKPTKISFSLFAICCELSSISSASLRYQRTPQWNFARRGKRSLAGLLASSEHEIWATRQTPRVEAISAPHTMDERANSQFGRVFFERTRDMISLRCSEEKVSGAKIQLNATRLVRGLGRLEINQGLSTLPARSNRPGSVLIVT